VEQGTHRIGVGLPVECHWCCIPCVSKHDTVGIKLTVERTHALSPNSPVVGVMHWYLVNPPDHG
jgi:hypothetical protein